MRQRAHGADLPLLMVGLSMRSWSLQADLVHSISSHEEQ